MRSWALISLVPLACAAAPRTSAKPSPSPSPPAPAPAQAAPTRPGSFVLVHAAADLYSAPRADAPRINAYAFPERGRQGHFANVFRLLAAEDDWLSLETLPEPAWAEHCHGSLIEAEGLALRVFARVQDRVAVTGREARTSYPDGTAVTLGAGVALWPKPQAGFYQVSAGGLTFSVSPEPSSVAQSYDPSPRFSAPERATRHLRQESIGSVRYGQTANVAKQSALLPVIYVAEEKPVIGGSLVTLPLGCAKLDVLAPAGAVANLDGLLGGLLLRREDDSGPAARSGAALFWRDGSLAGQAAKSFVFNKEVAPAASRRCFQKPLRYIDPKSSSSVDPRNLLELCLAAADVVEGPAKPAPVEPLRVKGARACSSEEKEREWCAENRRGGRCIEGSCITPRSCSAYCQALAAREHAGCEPKDLPADCAKVPDCAKHTREMKPVCAKMRVDSAQTCRHIVCEEIAKMPPPPAQ